MHALKREREALAAVEMEAGHGSRVSVSTHSVQGVRGVSCLLTSSKGVGILEHD